MQKRKKTERLHKKKISRVSFAKSSQWNEINSSFRSDRHSTVRGERRRRSKSLHFSSETNERKSENLHGNLRHRYWQSKHLPNDERLFLLKIWPLSDRTSWCILKFTENNESLCARCRETMNTSRRFSLHIWWSVVLRRLRLFGISSKIFRCFQSFYSDRQIELTDGRSEHRLEFPVEVWLIFVLVDRLWRVRENRQNSRRNGVRRIFFSARRFETIDEIVDRRSFSFVDKRKFSFLFRFSTSNGKNEFCFRRSGKIIRWSSLLVK